MENKPIKIVEITRSFSFKVNLGNFSNADFFCSQKDETTPDKAKEVSEALYQFCKAEVMRAVEEFKKENTIQPAKPKPIPKKIVKQEIQGEEAKEEGVKGEEKREEESIPLTNVEI